MCSGAQQRERWWYGTSPHHEGHPGEVEGQVVGAAEAPDLEHLGLVLRVDRHGEARRVGGEGGGAIVESGRALGHLGAVGAVVHHDASDVRVGGEWLWPAWEGEGQAAGGVGRRKRG